MLYGIVVRLLWEWHGTVLHSMATSCELPTHPMHDALIGARRLAVMLSLQCLQLSCLGKVLSMVLTRLY
jgi:hypothetical protein